MKWDDIYELDYFLDVLDQWNNKTFLGDCPVKAQYGLDLIFKTLVDDKEKYPYLTTMPESTEQVNSIMIDLLLTKYSRKYRKLKKRRSKEYVKMRKMYNK